MKVALLGGPDTGKSSYLVALFGALENHRGDSLALVDVRDEVGFLNRGLEALTRRERVKRTDIDSKDRVAITVRGPLGEIDLEIPDRSGELVKGMVNDRVWDEELLASIEDIDGLLLFLHVLRFDPGRSANEVEKLLGRDGGVDGLTGEEPESRQTDPIPWAPSLMPADVRAIDLLQAVLEQRSDPLPVAVVISAWDRAQPSNVKPSTWLKNRAPLLDQFLDSNRDRLPNTVFGVSAQGFDFTINDRATELAAALDPWERVHALDADGNQVGIERPILWLMQQDGTQ